MGLKMAKATAKDLDVAQELILFLNQADEGLLPPKSEGEESEEFDTESYEDLERFHNLAMEFLRIPSALERVVWGMQCIVDSGLLDPNSNVLDINPEIMANQSAAEEWDELLAEFKNLKRAYMRLLEVGHDQITQLGGDCDSVERMAADDEDLAAASAAIAKAEKSNQTQEAAKDKS